MNIFSEVKEQLTTRQVAESYGLRIRKNGVACCPFHDDRHPSMKVDKNYHCFACGVGGDVIDYTARMYDYPNTMLQRNWLRILDYMFRQKL